MSSPIPFWAGNPTPQDIQLYDFMVQNPWNTVVLGGVRLAGFCNVEIEKGQKVDVKKPSGDQGATLTNQGPDIAKIQIIWTIWGSNHNEQAQLAIRVFDNRSVFDPQTKKFSFKAWPIESPPCAYRDVYAVVIHNIVGPRDSSKFKGAKEFALHCFEDQIPTGKSHTATADAINPTPINKNSALAKPTPSGAGKVSPPGNSFDTTPFRG